MQYPSNNARAVAFIRGSSTAPSVNGRVAFYQRGRCVLVVADINGLPPNSTGFYGFHIHEGTACTGIDFDDSRSHYNPTGVPHPRHAGDLPPLMLCGRSAHSEVLTDRFNVTEIIGRTVIIHDNPDDFTTQPSGDAGMKIACGIIQWK